MKKATRKTGKQKATSKSKVRRSAAAGKPASSGVVYTDLLREALARRRGQGV